MTSRLIFFQNFLALGSLQGQRLRLQFQLLYLLPTCPQVSPCPSGVWLPSLLHDDTLNHGEDQMVQLIENARGLAPIIIVIII